MASVFNPSSWLKHLDFHAFSSWIYIFVYIILLSVAIACMLSLTLYFLPTMLLCLLKPQNMRKKYGNWAVVTGGSSGIGKAITRLLASQVRAFNITKFTASSQQLLTYITSTGSQRIYYRSR